ncbi:MAG: SRPBCC family protein [Candidatus Phosphoribacter sp.]|nr:SRPBCC family protein [Actinomycetales bacterium]
MTNPRDLITVQRLIPAPADAIFDLLADPSRHPEIDGSGTVLGPSSGRARRLAIGDVFGMNMKMGLGYATRNEVVEFIDGRRIAWRTLAAAPLDKVFTGRIWRYELEPAEGGTLVRESWDISREAPLSRPLVRRFMGSQARVNMARTLERIEQRFTS